MEPVHLLYQEKKVGLIETGEGSHGVVVDIMEVGMTVMDLVIVETVSEVVEASDILVARAITINFLI